MIAFSYCVDAAGNLIRQVLGEHPDALIPGSVELVSSAAELENPLPWTKTIRDAVNEIRFVPYQLVKGTVAASVHDTRRLPEYPFVFVSPVAARAPDADVFDLIDLYDDLLPGSDGRREIEAGLAEFGIEPIPLLSRFIPELYDGKPNSDVPEMTSYGWLSHTRIYRKATVR